MQNNILKQLEIDTQLQNIDFLKETCFQINKDLIGFTENGVKLTEALLEKPSEDLANQITSIITLIEDQNKLISFLYRVDLAEKKMVNYLTGNSTITQLAPEIIKRSTQKVFLRWYFSNRLKH